MRAFRLCRTIYPVYDGEGARRAGGRWNSKGIRVVYLSENRSLAVLEVLVHLSNVIPDKYLLGTAEIPNDISIEHVKDGDLPGNWAALDPREQPATRRIGDHWVEQRPHGNSFGPIRHRRRKELRAESGPSRFSTNSVR